MSISSQEYYDKAVTYIAQQEERCAVGGQCVYHRHDGNKCAVGYFIPDGHRAVSFSGSIAGLSARYPELSGIAWPAENFELARDLQDLHDFIFNRDENKGHLSEDGWCHAKEIAITHKLVPMTPERIKENVKATQELQS